MTRLTVASEWHLSPSQISLRKLCGRRWAASYGLRLKSPSSGGAVHGHALHAIKDEYLLDPDFKLGTTPYHNMFSAARRFLPDKGSATTRPREVFTELDLSMKLVGVTWKMFADVVVNSPLGLFIDDLKTSSDPKKYAIRQDQLWCDPQSIMYSLAAMKLFGRRRCTMRFIRIKKWNPERKLPHPKPYADVVTKQWSMAEAVRAYEEHIRPTADLCVHDYEHPKLPMAYDPSPGACHLYPMAGCPFQPFCEEDVSQMDRLMARLEEEERRGK